jgi:CheY-like chemotaxis protein
MKIKRIFSHELQWHGLCTSKDYLLSRNWKPIEEEQVMKRLLIVDDNTDHRLILRTMLEAKGYGCEEAEDGGVALSKLETDQVALVLTDLNMPGMNGLELIAQMGKLALLQNTPAILMTSQPLADMSSEAYKTGACAVISKPYDFPKILEEVGSAIGQPESLELTRIA